MQCTQIFHNNNNNNKEMTSSSGSKLLKVTYDGGETSTTLNRPGHVTIEYENGDKYVGNVIQVSN